MMFSVGRRVRQASSCVGQIMEVFGRIVGLLCGGPAGTGDHDPGERPESADNGARQARRNYSRVIVTSPLEGTRAIEGFPAWSERGWAWRTFCACCQRPIHIEALEGREEASGGGGGGGGGAAISVVIWGAKRFVVQACVLGESLRVVAERSVRLILFYVPPMGEEDLQLLLAAGWEARSTTHVACPSRLLISSEGQGRLTGVMTKLRAFSLLEFDKVLALDADLVVEDADAIAALLEDETLALPAAMRRGMNFLPGGYRHGEWLRGDQFFSGSPFWGVGTGINGAVLLIRPAAEDYGNLMAQAEDDRHPAHGPGPAPDQDFLSRFFAGRWHHLSVAYNFQLWQMVNSLEYESVYSSERASSFLSSPTSAVAIWHFGGELWDYQAAVLRGTEVSPEFVETYLEEHFSWQLWVLRSAESWGHVAGERSLCRWDGESGRLLSRWRWAEGGGVGGGGWREGDECEPPPPPAAAVEGCRRLAGRAFSCWGRHYAAFWARLPEELQQYCDRGGSWC